MADCELHYQLHNLTAAKRIKSGSYCGKLSKMHAPVTWDPLQSRGLCACLNFLWLLLPGFVSRPPCCEFAAPKVGTGRVVCDKRILGVTPNVLRKFPVSVPCCPETSLQNAAPLCFAWGCCSGGEGRSLTPGEHRGVGAGTLFHPGIKMRQCFNAYLPAYTLAVTRRHL